MTPLMTELLARQRQREFLDASSQYRLGRELRRPTHAPTRVVVLALVWLAELVARHLDRIADTARSAPGNVTAGVPPVAAVSGLREIAVGAVGGAACLRGRCPADPAPAVDAATAACR